MSVGLLLITHNRIGDELLKTARSTLGLCPLQTGTLAFTPQHDPDRMAAKACRLVHELDTGEGVLVLTDAYGSTPSNIASYLTPHERVTVIAGLNLPMLLRVLNYPSLSRGELAEKALSGGRDGVILVEAVPDD